MIIGGDKYQQVGGDKHQQVGGSKHKHVETSINIENSVVSVFIPFRKLYIYGSLVFSTSDKHCL